MKKGKPAKKPMPTMAEKILAELQEQTFRQRKMEQYLKIICQAELATISVLNRAMVVNPEYYEMLDKAFQKI